MSKVKIEGNASGTGTLTISAPNTNTDRTINLPDDDITLAAFPDAIDVNASAPADSLAIDSSGKVGIGTSSPSETLSVSAGADGVVARFTGASSSRGLLIKSENGLQASNLNTIDSRSSGSEGILGFATDGTERMRIDSSGNLLVGKTSADGTAGSSVGVEIRPNGEVQSTRNNGNAGMFSRRGTDGNAILFRRDTTSVGSISVTGSSTAYNTSSDYRLKENVVDMTDAIDRVKALQPKRFNFIADEDDTTVDGFLAHEVSDVIPEAISGEKDATKEEEYEVTPAVLDDDGNVVTEAVMGTRTVPDYQGIDQSKLVPLLTGALQEAIAKIEALETRIEALENA